MSCRELQQLRVSKVASATSAMQSQPPGSPQAEQQPSAAQLAATQQACNKTEEQVTSLQGTVQQLAGGIIAC